MFKKFLLNTSGVQRLQRIFLVALFLLFTFNYSQAATLYWFGTGANQNWSTLTGNWSTSFSTFAQASAIPAAGDDVIIAGTTANITSTDVITINSLKVSSSTTTTSTLNLASGASLTINRTTGVAYNNDCTLAGGTINNNGATISITHSQNLSGCNAIQFKNPDAVNPNSNNVFNNASGSLTASTSTQTSNSSYPIQFSQNVSDNSKFTTGGTITLTPPSGNNNGNYTINITSNDVTIDGPGTISAGTSGANAAFGLINIKNYLSGNYSLNIGSGNTLNSYSTGFNSVGGAYLGPINIQSNPSSGTSVVTFLNNGTINIGGNSTTGIYIVAKTASTSSITNNGTLNLNGAMTTAPIQIALTGANTFTNTGNINYNTTAANTSNVALFDGFGAAVSYINSGTITIGANTALTNAMKLYGSNVSFSNTGTVNIGSGQIYSNVGTGATPAVFNNNEGGTLNFSTTTASSTLVSTGVALTNNGSITTAPTTNALTLNTGIANSNNWVNFGSTSVFSPGGTGNGIINITNSVALKGTLNMNVTGTTTAGTDYDQIVSNTSSAAIDLSGATLALTMSALTPADGTTITLINSNGTSGTVTGTFASVTGLGTSWAVVYTSSAVQLKYSAVLPIIHTSFTGNSGLSGVDLNWKTASETNNDYFTLYQSIDGKVFNKIVTVVSLGNSANEKAYHFLDKNPSNRTDYYQLSQTDLDGKTETSNPINVNYKIEGQNDLKVYSNENSMELRVNWGKNEMVDVNVFDISGKKMFNSRIKLNKSNNLVSLKIQEGLKANLMYILNVSGTNRNAVSKFLFNHSL